MDPVVISRECTLILPELNLELVANIPTQVPAEHLSKILAYPGLEEVSPSTSPTH